MSVEPTLTFGELLKRFLHRTDLNQKELAIESGITPNYLSMFISGQRVPPKHIVDALANVLCLTPRERDKLHQSAATGKHQHDTSGLRVDWGEAPDTGDFYGRCQELTELKQWVVNDRCR